jgi:manganese-dependent inorganic pyrophosphatase
MKPIYVIGHKNPDLDSIAAAIGYKTYKQSTDQGIYIAAAAGEVNDAIINILDHLNIAPPLIIRSVAATVEDLLESNEIISASPDMNLVELSNLMRNFNLKTIPVLDKRNKFLGLLTIGDLAMILMDTLGDGKEIDKTPEKLRSILDRKVVDIMKTRDLLLFEKDEPVDEARKNMLSTRFRNYPVVDHENHYLGMISRYNLLQMKRKKLILVDHNETKQAVDGVEEAEVIEIVDHHRVGDLETISPIYFHNEPVGSTSTLVAERFFANKIYMAKNIAGLLLSGILADTMLFKSPTTTKKDEIIAEKLSQIAGLDINEWGIKIFEMTTYNAQMTDYEIVTKDLKEYTSENIIFAVAQFETIDLDAFKKKKNFLIKTMEEICRSKNYAFMCLMVTDIMKQESSLIITGDKKSVLETAFGPHDDGASITLKGVMSRKKQVVPVIYEALRKENMM